MLSMYVCLLKLITSNGMNCLQKISSERILVRFWNPPVFSKGAFYMQRETATLQQNTSNSDD